jgi:hypothetical protein
MRLRPIWPTAFAVMSAPATRPDKRYAARPRRLADQMVMAVSPGVPGLEAGHGLGHVG